jgi:hypothetical protein
MPPKKLIYQFKITLKEIHPPIWRRIQVPSTYTFWDLHVAIQDAMEWMDYHLHEFKVKDPLTGASIFFGIPNEDDAFLLERQVLPDWNYKIAKYISLINTTVEYVYDFGDNWKHKLKLEEIVLAEQGVTYPQCLSGKRASPPEDCGGPWGYQDMLEILTDPEHKEYEDTKSWVESMKEGPFNAERFDNKQIHFDDPKERFQIAFKGGIP